MDALIRAFSAAIAVARSFSLALVVLWSILAVLVYLVRAKKVQPFSGAGRFIRGSLDPLVRPFDRRLARHGVIGMLVPLWSIVIVIVAVAGVIFLLTFVRDALMSAFFASNAGPRGAVSLVLRWSVGALQLALLVRIVTSWIGGSYSALGRLAFRMTEWFLAPIRRLLPPMGMVDFSPFLGWLALSLILALVLRFV